MKPQLSRTTGSEEATIQAFDEGKRRIIFQIRPGRYKDVAVIFNYYAGWPKSCVTRIRPPPDAGGSILPATAWRSFVFLSGDNLGPAFGYGCQKLRSIGFINYATVENNHNAGVFCAANQPSEALFELDNSRWQLVIVKGIAPLFGNLLESAGEQGLVGHCKRQANNNHV